MTGGSWSATLSGASSDDQESLNASYVSTGPTGASVTVNSELDLPICLPSTSRAVAAAPKVSGSAVTVKLSCPGAGNDCAFVAELDGDETIRGGKVVAVTAGAREHGTQVIFDVKQFTLSAGASRTVRISLNATGQRLLKQLRSLKVQMLLVNNETGKRIRSSVVTFRSRAGKR